MPEVIDGDLFESQTPLPPTQRIVSRIIDVSGAQHVSVNVALTPPVDTEKILCAIFFGRSGHNDFLPLPVESFGPANTVMITSVPVSGRKLQVIVENQGSQATAIHLGTVYGVREAP